MNNEIIFYPKRNNGFFSNLFEIIDFIHLYDNPNIDKLDINNFSPKYFDEELNDKCSFYHFFKNEVDKNIIFDKLFGNEWYLNYPIRYNNYDVNNIILNKGKLFYINNIICKYLNLKDELNNKINQKYLDYFQNKNILGIHIRQTDHYHHGNILDISNYITEINKLKDNYDNIYIMTDNKNIIDILKQLYSNVIIFDDVLRCDNNKGIHEDESITNNYKKGEDVILETYLLSKCSRIIVTNSNISSYVLCLQPNIEFNFIDINYKNYE